MPIMGGTFVEWKGQRLEAVRNEDIRDGSLQPNGFNPAQDQEMILIRTDQFMGEDRPARRDEITIDGENRLVERIAFGEASISIVLTNKDKRSNAG